MGSTSGLGHRSGFAPDFHSVKYADPVIRIAGFFRIIAL